MRITLTRSKSLRLIIVCACALLCGAANAQSSGVQIIPAPKQLTLGQGSFAVSNARVVLADNKSAEDQFAAQDFIDDMKATAGVSLSLSRGQSRREILVGRIDLLPIAQALKRGGAEPPATLNEEGYLIVANADRVIVAETGKRLLGFITCRRDANRIGVIELVGVAPGHASRGIGRLLVRAALDCFEQLGAEIVTVRTQVTNTAAVNLYSATGARLAKVDTTFVKLLN